MVRIVLAESPNLKNMKRFLQFVSFVAIVTMQPLYLWGQSIAAQSVELFSDAPSDWQDARDLMLDEVRAEGDAVLLKLNTSAFESTRKADLDTWAMTLPKPSGVGTGTPENLDFELERFFVHPSVITVGMTSKDGYKEEEYIPQLQTFKLRLNNRTVGTLTLMKDEVMGSFHHDGQQYDLTRIKEDAYAILDFNRRTKLAPFECGVVDDDYKRADGEGQQKLVESSSNGGCVEVAVDVDNFTYLTYNNMSNATDWALAQMAGVEAIYTQELNGLVLLTVSFVHLWQTQDPMASFTNDAGGMLTNFRSTWEGTSTLDAVQRDVTHLMTKRNNTGTGGIAYLDVNCGSFAYGFSSAMSNSTTTNINSYSWNLDVVSHELGHNFGANHTHWCGWPGGPIDNCAAAEGGCNNGPAVSSGTIMSYCHTTSTGKTLVFHPVVEQNALIPKMSAASCYGACDGWTAPECSITNIQGGVQQACDPLTLTYTQQVIISHEYAPASGFLIVNGYQTTISNSPQSVNLIGEPADGQNENVSAYFTSDEGCALTKTNAFTHRQPCCGQFRLTYVDPSSNILRIRNEADCPGQLTEWGLLTPDGFTHLTDLVSQGQNLTVDPGETVQISWAAGLVHDWIMLFLPTSVAYDYVQWGSNAPANIYFLQYDELDVIWPGGGDVFIDALPPYSYTGSGEYGVEQWSGQDIPCEITNIEVTSATSCDETTNTYDLTYQVTWVGTPDTGGLSVNGTSYSTSGNILTQTVTLPADGTWTSLTATFDDEPTCTSTLGNAYFGPQSCAVCPADVNNNGAIEVSDVLDVLSEFGCASGCSPNFDLDGDDSITVADILLVLSAFGEIC